MNTLAFEFPVHGEINKRDFIAESIAWLRGIKASNILNNNDIIENFGDEFSLRAEDGEYVSFREINVGGVSVVGFRHEIKDSSRRVWRTEVTLTISEEGRILRVNSQCDPHHIDVKTQIPKKPFFVKSVIDSGWGAKDGFIYISADSILVKSENINEIIDLISGRSSVLLPCILLTRRSDGGLVLSDKLLRALSYQVGGMAHVLVEPSFDFLRNSIGKRCVGIPYGGAVGVFVGGIGIVRKIYDFSIFDDEEHLVQELIRFISTFHTNRQPKKAWGFQDLMEVHLRNMRNKVESGEKELDEWLSLQQEESDNKDARIKKLESDIEELQKRVDNNFSDCILDRGLIQSIGDEIYDGEFFDRIRSILVDSLDAGNIHPRTRIVIERFCQKTKFTGNAKNLDERLKSAGKNSGNAEGRLSELLYEMGYVLKRHTKHPIYEPKNAFGLTNQMLSCTASDVRSGRNAASQISNMLGLEKLR